MDRNPNEGIPHSTFAPPYPFPPSAPAFGKPSPAAGLSRPRLMKVRKHVASPWVKPAVAPESGAGPGFNPFRPGPSAADPPNWEDSGMQVLHDRIPTWRPFNPEAGTGVPENSSCPNSGSSESSDPQSASFVFGAGSVSKDIGSGDIPGPIFGFGSKEIGNSETATFAFGSGVKKPSNLSRALPEDSSGLNLGSSESVKSESAGFVFGSGTISIPSTRNDRAGNEEDNAFISTSEQVGNSDSDVFVCGGAVKNSSNLGRNSSLGSNAVSFSQSHLPDEMRSLKLQSLGNEDGHENNFIFGGSKNAQTEVSGNPDASTENLFTRPHQNVTFSLKKGESKGSRTRRGKSRQSTLGAKQFFSREKVLQENPEIELPGDYSPMDYSPCDESFVTGQCSREASVASDEPIHFVSRSASTEGIISATQRLGIDDGDLECREMDEDGSKAHGERNFAVESSFVVDRTSGFGSGNLEFKYENIDLDSSSRVIAAEAETGSFRSNIEREGSEGGMLFTSTSSVEDHCKLNYTFAAPPSIQGPILASKHHYRRKNRMRTGQDAYNSTPNDRVPLTSSSPKLFRAASTSVHPDPTQDLNGIPFVPQTENNNIADKKKKPEASQASVTTDGASIAAQETCEKWRFRGNQAYANGHLSKAEDYYTRGVNSVSLNETSRSCMRSLMLCYSNRAATWMSLGRMQEAISDCKMAIAIDPDFLRAQVRAANCHLALGEIEDALKHFKKCLQSENDANSNQKIRIEASEGLRKAQQVADYMDQSAELLLKRTTNDATKALQIASEALSISPLSENLMEMKAESLLMLRNFEDVIQLCEETLDSAKKSSIVNSAEGQSKDTDSSRYMESSHERLWRWRLISKSYFLLGKLEEAVEILEKHENVKIITDNELTRYRSWSPDSSTSLMVTIRDLLRHKAAGNEAFQAGRHSEAVEHYTAALACNSESRPFVAICFCNRAASYQALGQITDAIADCSLAIALDASYPKAISRRATLHEMIRDFGQAAKDLTRLISLLENHIEDKDNTSATLVRSTTNSSDLKRARLRLSTMEEEAGKGTPLDLYMILGIDSSSSAADVKKAYRKAALRHHPDKAGHFLARSENVCDGLWREVADEVHIYADRLFKMIGEAYTILSDPTKRLQYDVEEDTRTSTKVHSGSSTSKTPSDNYSSRDDRSADRRNWWDHGSSHQRSSESSRSGSGAKTWNYGV